MSEIENWIVSSDNPGYLSKTIKKGSATIIILRPILDDKERVKREAHVKAAFESAFRDYYLRKEGNKNVQGMSENTVRSEMPECSRA